MHVVSYIVSSLEKGMPSRLAIHAIASPWCSRASFVKPSMREKENAHATGVHIRNLMAVAAGTSACQTMAATESTRPKSKCRSARDGKRLGEC